MNGLARGVWLLSVISIMTLAAPMRGDLTQIRVAKADCCAHMATHHGHCGSARTGGERSSHDLLRDLQPAAWSRYQLVEHLRLGQTNKTKKGKTQSFLLESDYQRNRDTFYTRFEYVEKSVHDLVLPENFHDQISHLLGRDWLCARSHSPRRPRCRLRKPANDQPSPENLDSVYGDDFGYGFQIFLRIRPSRH